MLKSTHPVLLVSRYGHRSRAFASLLLSLVLFIGQPIAVAAQGAADAPMDFDGDGRTDYCVVRVENDELIWYVQPANGAPQYAFQWGIFGDVAIPEDFDGDGRDDVAVWRPTANSAFFYILQSQSNTFRIVEFGLVGDDPSV